MMNKMDLVIVEDYFLRTIHKIRVENGFIEISADKFIAIGIEVSKPAKNWEYSDPLNVIVLIKGKDDRYYVTKIENYPEYFLTPRYAQDNRNIRFVEELQFAERQLITDIYAISDSREQYTLTIEDSNSGEKVYQIYEKYLDYKISVGSETFDYEPDSTLINFLLWVRCQVCHMRQVDSSEYLENKIIHYGIWVRDLLNVSVLECPYFEPWQGKVSVDGINVTLEE